jgi:hypothetical protein
MERSGSLFYLLPEFERFGAARQYADDNEELHRRVDEIHAEPDS